MLVGGGGGVSVGGGGVSVGTSATGVSVGGTAGVSATSGKGVLCCRTSGVGVGAVVSGNSFMRRGVLVGVGVTSSVAIGPHASIGTTTTMITPNKNINLLFIILNYPQTNFTNRPTL